MEGKTRRLFSLLGQREECKKSGGELLGRTGQQQGSQCKHQLSEKHHTYRGRTDGMECHLTYQATGIPELNKRGQRGIGQWSRFSKGGLAGLAGGPNKRSLYLHWINTEVAGSKARGGKTPTTPALNIPLLRQGLEQYVRWEGYSKGAFRRTNRLK